MLADPAQAIFGFTTDRDGIGTPSTSLLDRMARESPKPFTRRRLDRIYRTKDVKLQDLYVRARKEMEVSEPGTVVDRIQEVIRDGSASRVESSDMGDLTSVLQSLPTESLLVLFRRRVDALVASSYCSNAGIVHRLRMSDMPTVVHPWIGWLLHDETRSSLRVTEFDELWLRRLSECNAPFEGLDPRDCWNVLHKIAAGRAQDTLDLEYLRGVLSRSRPPIELCTPDFGNAGPILGTIHASKGREADTVLLFLTAGTRVGDKKTNADEFHREEGRVYYVGATRARKILLVADGKSRPGTQLDSKRIYRKVDQKRVQIEVGRRDDVDRIAHLRWENALGLQGLLAGLVGQTLPARATATAEHGYRRRISVAMPYGNFERIEDIGELSESFDADINQLWGRTDIDRALRPSNVLRHLYVVAVSTVGIGEAHSETVGYPFSRSRIGLAPVVKGFSVLNFVGRQTGRQK
jgi:hypothetical protein